MGTSSIVVGHPLGHDVSYMPLIERNEPVQTFAKCGSDQSFAERIRLRNSRRCLQRAQTHRPQDVVDGRREYRVAITHDEPVRLVAGAEASELLCGPLSRRVFSDIPMQNAPASPPGFVRRLQVSTCDSLSLKVVRKRGLEPSRCCHRQPLKPLHLFNSLSVYGHILMVKT